VKKALTGNGRADKRQMTNMVTRILGLSEPPKPADAADALALAVCHCWRAPFRADALARHHQQTELEEWTTVIASLRGTVIDKGLDSCRHRVRRCRLPLPGDRTDLRRHCPRGEEVFVLTTMVVREDSQTLYAFPDAASHARCSDCSSRVSGVGARLAMGTDVRAEHPPT
jgi:hypothetical protein